MQIQGTGEIGSTKRKLHLSGVPLIESKLYPFSPVKEEIKKIRLELELANIILIIFANFLQIDNLL